MRPHSLPRIYQTKVSTTVSYCSSRDRQQSLMDDCLLSEHIDIAMPGMSGPEQQQELIRRRQEIPIVFITAQSDETIRPRVIARGTVECLFKPFSEAALIDALNTALRMR